MKNAWLERWETRYNNAEYAYGIIPNVFLKNELGKLEIGKILFGAEGEGRNAVFAAKLGWDVYAFDISNFGKEKALKLAQENLVKINYQIGELPDLEYNNEFDAIALIFAHFPANIKSQYHRLLDAYLRKGGIIIFEAFSKNHLSYKQKNENVGGPNNIDDLFSIEEIKQDFSNYEIIELSENIIELNEGLYHRGTGSVIRFVGKKK